MQELLRSMGAFQQLGSDAVAAATLGSETPKPQYISAAVKTSDFFFFVTFGAQMLENAVYVRVNAPCSLSHSWQISFVLLVLAFPKCWPPYSQVAARRLS